ncbi:dihydroxyacetone kinase subunit DhaL [Rhizosaccharibacter radicis]|uniref:Dihydroxyacetone kinase subunit DhaL n=1 Tax=Rhizosaccharibacter radicis TaxID=2782605 RepID=A0ABT1VSP0_9PROT|nr:dihydroxyacetone kinase subunit DhaL [Acetobacteraceae bacterium KSS12]
MSESITLADAAPIAIDISKAVVAARDHLSEIDAATGDGDHGINMAKGFKLAIDRLSGKPFDLRQGFATIGDTLLGDIGGSMGPLYGSLFTEMADTLDGKEAIDRDGFTAMLRAAEAAIVDLGAAKVGDKTLIDVLTPSREAYEKAVGENKDFAGALTAMRDAAAAGLESTRDMVAKLGRASRLGERSRGVLDAGAASCELILRTLADGLLARLAA